MRFKIVLTSFCAAFLTIFAAYAGPAGKSALYRQAKNLYDNSMYVKAREIFESLSPDPLCDGYAVLCAFKTGDPEAERLADRYVLEQGSGSLVTQIRFEQALCRFNSNEYAEAYAILSGIDGKILWKSQRSEFTFKKAYCLYDAGNYDDAFKLFEEVRSSESGEYRTSAVFYSALIEYSRRNFASAKNLFSTTVKDGRFADLSGFYIVDCAFNLKDYGYVISEGEKIYPGSPADRQSHLARLISESCLVKGLKNKAREYYGKYSPEEMEAGDYYYAASVLYGVSDYAGAAEKYSRFVNEASVKDSLWQVANYNLANSYMQLRNQVGALDAFKAASELTYNPKITEDATFNYAKLAFDLNKDTSGFARYIREYSEGKGDEIYSYMALAALYDHDYERAVAAYDNIEELTPDMRGNYAKANYLRSRQLISNESYAAAIKCLKAASYYVPSNDRFNQLTRYWLAESYYHTDDYALARAKYTELYNSSALEGKSEGLLLPYNVAYCYYAEGDYSNSAKWFDKYLSSGVVLYKNDALVRRADCDFARKDYKSAVRSYDKALSVCFDVNDIYPYYKQAMAYGLSGDKKTKAKVLSVVEKAQPSSAGYFEALYELGNVRMDIKDNKGAVSAFSRLRRNAVDSTYAAKALLGMGMVSRNTKKYEDALTYYKRVVMILPGTEYAETALSAIQSIYQSMGTPEKYPEFVQSYNAASSNAEKEQMYFTTAEQIYMSGRYNDALTACLKFVGDFPESRKMSDVYFYIADSYRALGEKDKACEYYMRCRNAEGGVYGQSALLNYAVICYGLGKYADAASAYSQLSLESQDDDARFVAYLGRMRSNYRAREYEKAIESSELVLSSPECDNNLKREAKYVEAKSFLLTSRRSEAIRIFTELSETAPETPEGAEASCFLIQNYYDKGEFSKVESAVFEFSKKSGNQSYWLAKAYMILGDSFVERGNVEQARATYESIRDGYEPNGSEDDIPENVRMRIERLNAKTNQ